MLAVIAAKLAINGALHDLGGVLRTIRGELPRQWLFFILGKQESALADQRKDFVRKVRSDKSGNAENVLDRSRPPFFMILLVAVSLDHAGGHPSAAFNILVGVALAPTDIQPESVGECLHRKSVVKGKSVYGGVD